MQREVQSQSRPTIQPVIDLTPSAGLEQALFYSHDCKLIGGLYIAANDSPRPTAIMLHGVPGVEKNLDIASALRDAGWNCLYFHYRGCWGSEGDYSFGGLVDDVRAATDWAVAHPLVDAARLVLMGSSMGGYATMAAAAGDERYRALIPMCPLVDPRAVPLTHDMATEFAAMLNGVTTDQLLEQWEHLQSLPALADGIGTRPVLLLSGDRDEFFPPAHMQLLVDALPNVEWQRFAQADHIFSTVRPQLTRAILDWLSRTLPV